MSNPPSNTVTSPVHKGKVISVGKPSTSPGGSFDGGSPGRPTASVNYYTVGTPVSRGTSLPSQNNNNNNNSNNNLNSSEIVVAPHEHPLVSPLRVNSNNNNNNNSNSNNNTTNNSLTGARVVSNTSLPDSKSSPMLQQPLSVQAIILRHPEYNTSHINVFKNSNSTVGESALQFTEEGDILHEVLGKGLEPAVLPPHVLLPSTLSSYLLGESFQALLVLQNTAAYPLSALKVSLDLRYPPSSYRCDGTPVEKEEVEGREVERLEGKATYSIPLQVPLSCGCGEHKLVATITYQDPSRQMKKLLWETSVFVEKGIELQRLRYGEDGRPQMGYTLRRTPLLAEEKGKPPHRLSSIQTRIEVPFQFKNESSGCITLTEATLTLSEEEKKNGLQLVGPTPRPLQVLLTPGDVYSGYGSLVIPPSHPFLLSLPSTAPIVGELQWSWARQNGHSQHPTPSTLRLPLYLPSALLPPYEVLAVSVGEGREGKAFRAGEPVSLRCVLLCHCPSTGIQLGLKVRSEGLAPDWCYAGPGCVPLPAPSTDGKVYFTVELLPWGTGWVSLSRGIEIVDYHAQGTVLWPSVQERTRLPPPPHQRDAIALEPDRPQKSFELCTLLVL